MTKIGRKGFMLAEVIVVAVVIATVLVTIYTGLNNISSAYETRNRYYDIDSLYVAMEINNILMKKSASTINTTEAMKLSDNGEIEIFENFYKKTGNVVYSYITPYNKNKIISLKSFNNNNSFSDYIDYLNGNLDFDADYDYMVVVERRENNNNDDCYYYALKLNY